MQDFQEASFYSQNVSLCHIQYRLEILNSSLLNACRFDSVDYKHQQVSRVCSYEVLESLVD